MDDTWLLVWGMEFGSIGVGYFIYGKKQKSKIALLTGVSLMIFPYFVANVFALIAVGLMLMLVPFFFEI